MQPRGIPGHRSRQRPQAAGACGAAKTGWRQDDMCRLSCIGLADAGRVVMTSLACTITTERPLAPNAAAKPKRPRVNHHRGTSRVRPTLRDRASGGCSMGESDGVATSRRNGGASPVSVGAWVLVAQGAVDRGAKMTLTTFGRHHPWAIGPRGLMAQMLPMPTRQDRHPVLRVVLVIADDALHHVEAGSGRLIRHDHREVRRCWEFGGVDPRIVYTDVNG
jgi:hypothetical protein